MDYRRQRGRLRRNTVLMANTIDLAALGILQSISKRHFTTFSLLGGLCMQLIYIAKFQLGSFIVGDLPKQVGLLLDVLSLTPAILSCESKG